MPTANTPTVSPPRAATSKRSGKRRRKRAPRSSIAQWQALPSRQPQQLIASQASGRIPSLVERRNELLLASPWGLMRGTAIVMAHDLAQARTSGIEVQICGDAHIGNFSWVGTPERRLVLDVDDFDETCVGPFEWDVARLAASIEVAGRAAGYSADERTSAATACTHAYRTTMRELARAPELDIWHAALEAGPLIDKLVKAGTLTADQKARGMAMIDKATSKDAGTWAQHHSADETSGRRLKPKGQKTIRAEDAGLNTDRAIVIARDVLATCLEGMPAHTAALAQRFEVIDVALRISGVGSLGFRRFRALLQGPRRSDLLVVDVKEAAPCSLVGALPDDHDGAGAGRWSSDAERIVHGQRQLQAASDILLGFTSRPVEGCHWYMRQHGDWSHDLAPTDGSAADMRLKSAMAGATLAHAHARGGDRHLIAGYLGKSDIFDRSMAAFASVYADTVESDHHAMTAQHD